MNKKMIIIAASLFVGSGMLANTAFASLNYKNGYEAYKEAIKAMVDVKSVTADVSITIKDNGSEVFNDSSVIKLDGNKLAASCKNTIKSGSLTEKIDFYEEDGKEIIKREGEDTYTVLKHNESFNDQKAGKLSPQMEKSIELFTDALVGNMQNYASISNTSANTKVSIELKGNVIPIVFNAGAVLLSEIRNVSEEKLHQNKETPFYLIDSKIPQLGSNIKIESISGAADINSSKLLDDQAAAIVVSGDDKNGKKHTLTIDMNMKFSDYNKTSADSVDLSGKAINVIR